MESTSSHNVTVLIFGASGDLTARKIIPALYNLWVNCYIPRGLKIIGVARREKDDTLFRQEMRDACQQNVRDGLFDSNAYAAFAGSLHYHILNFDDREGYAGLKERLEEIETENGPAGTRLFYLSVLPNQFGMIARHLGENGFISPPDALELPITRLIVEKPFGRDLESARALNTDLQSVLDEKQIFRIDHYLGKETVQNLLSFRFGNAIFEPLFNNHFVDHIQISALENLGMEAGRGAYYDKSGAMRDMVQNHLIQLLCFIAMEPPSVWGGKEIRDEKLKALKALTPKSYKNVDEWAIRGQYGPGSVNGKQAPGYREEERIAPQSNTPTYVALRVGIDNWRWAGTPIYLRSGKRLATRATEIAIVFKKPPLQFFKTIECDQNSCWMIDTQPNVLTFRIQPDERISLCLSVKRPGMEVDLNSVDMNFLFKETYANIMPDAYERLLIDAIRGDTTLFMRSDEIEAAWEFITPILDHWEANPCADFPNYAAGSWGPEAADRLFGDSTYGWRKI